MCHVTVSLLNIRSSMCIDLAWLDPTGLSSLILAQSLALVDFQPFLKMILLDHTVPTSNKLQLNSQRSTH